MQLLLSLHSAVIAAAGFLRVAHPVDVSQNDSWHMSLGAAHEILVYTHAFPEHESIVHALLSLHSSAIALADLFTSPHDVASLHVGLRQMSSDVHAAPMSV